MKLIALLVGVLMLTPITVFGGEKVKNINMKLSGTVISVGDAQIYDVNLKGAPGKARAQGAGSGVIPVPLSGLPAGHICDDNPFNPGGTAGLLLVHAQATMTFEDLSLLFLNVAEGAYACLFTPFVLGAYDIIGGTGRFEDASGYIVMEFNLYRDVFPSGSLVGAETGVAYGEIVLP